MSESTSTDITATLDNLMIKIGELEARVTRLEGQVEFHRDSSTEDDDA